MNAVWLNDELMVSPTAVAAIVTRYEKDVEGARVARVISVMFTGGQRVDVTWLSENEDRDAARAEMERLSALLWPPLLAERPDRAIEFNAFFNAFYDGDRSMYDPELYGLPVCKEMSTNWLPGTTERGYCNLALGHPGDHRYGPTFDEAYPPT